jgi:hypothetical protein
VRGEGELKKVRVRVRRDDWNEIKFKLCGIVVKLLACCRDGAVFARVLPRCKLGLQNRMFGRMSSYGALTWRDPGQVWLIDLTYCLLFYSFCHFFIELNMSSFLRKINTITENIWIRIKKKHNWYKT